MCCTIQLQRLSELTALCNTHLHLTHAQTVHSNTATAVARAHRSYAGSPMKQPSASRAASRSSSSGPARPASAATRAHAPARSGFGPPHRGIAPRCGWVAAF